MFSKIATRKSLILFCFGLSLMLFVWFVLSTKEIIDPFLYPRLVYGELMRNEGKLASFVLDRTTVGRLDRAPFFELLIVILIKIGGFTGYQLAFLPIGGILVALSYFVLSRRLFRSNALALMLTLTLMYEPALEQSMYNVYYEGIAFTIYLVAIFSCIGLVIQRKRAYFVCLLLLFIGAQYIHPIFAPWILALFLAYIVAYLFKQVRKSILNPRRAWALIFCLLTIHLATSDWFFYYLVMNRDVLSLQQVISLFVERVMSVGTRSKELTTVTEYIHIQELGSPYLAQLQLVYHLLTITPVVVYFLFMFKDVKSRHSSNLLKSNWEQQKLVLWGAGVTSLLNVLLYVFFVGYPGTKYNLFFFPIPATLALFFILKKSKRTRTRAKPIIWVFLLLLLVVNAGKFSLAINETLAIPEPYSSVQVGADWILKNNRERGIILSDFPTSGAIALRLSMKGHVPTNVRSITTKIYESLRNSSYSDLKISFLLNSSSTLVMGEKTLSIPFYADNYWFVPPLNSVIEQRFFDKIYDGPVVMFTTYKDTLRQP